MVAAYKVDLVLSMKSWRRKRYNRRVDHLLRATARAEMRHFWFRGFRAFVTPLLQYAAAGRPDPRLLDCGCGTGANVELLGTFGRAFGFDLTEIGLKIGREAGRTRLARATVTAVPFPTASFDIVTSFDVLYSLQDDDEQTAISEMYRLLKPGGFAIVNVAAMPLLRGDHSVLSREVRRYRREDLRSRLIRLVGQGHISATSRAMDDAGQRVSRYLLMQLGVNVSYGVSVAVGLWFIGVPNAILWGILGSAARARRCGGRQCL